MSELTFRQYQKGAIRTAKKLPHLRALTRGALGLCGESGEVAEHVKKYVIQGHDLNRMDILDELGDVLRYLTMLAEELGYDLLYVAEYNLAKLQARYPDGFSLEKKGP